MSKLTMHWPSVSGTVKMGDHIMMLSALADYGKSGFKWTVGPYSPDKMNQELNDIYRSKIPRQIKLDRKEVRGRPSMIYHKDHTFPIIQPDKTWDRPIEEKYVIISTTSANPERQVKIEPIPGIKNVVIDGWKTSMDELYQWISNAEHFYGSHSGPMWVAVSCRIPTTVYYRPSAKCMHAEHNWKLLEAQNEYGGSVRIVR